MSAFLAAEILQLQINMISKVRYSLGGDSYRIDSSHSMLLYRFSAGTDAEANT